ncbi:MAG: sugar transferase [Acidimicrobiia bacterium]
MENTSRGLRAIKRVLDVALAGVALVPAAIVLAVCAPAIRRSLGKGVIFRQERAGQHGEPIEVLKLRTMTDERDTNGDLLPDGHRLTRVGSLLRKTSLDEVPQLWNVLRGDMSLVGPRPLPMAYVARYSDEQRRRLDVKPGLTGWAQVRGRNALTWPDKLALDVWYVDNASLLVDLKIMLMTLKTVLTRGGVSAEGHATMPEFMGELDA